MFCETLPNCGSSVSSVCLLSQNSTELSVWIRSRSRRQHRPRPRHQCRPDVTVIIIIITPPSPASPGGFSSASGTWEFDVSFQARERDCGAGEASGGVHVETYPSHGAKDVSAQNQDMEREREREDEGDQWEKRAEDVRKGSSFLRMGRTRVCGCMV